MPNKGSKKDYVAPVKFNAFFDEFELVVGGTTTVHTKEGEREIPNNSAIIFTDIELIEETNARLEPGQRITRQTFENWKKAWKDETLEPSIAERFFCVYQKALRNAKERLFNSMVIEPNSWQRFAWIMERKFSETWGKKDDKENDKPTQPIQIVKTYEQKKI